MGYFYRNYIKYVVGVLLILSSLYLSNLSKNSWESENELHALIIIEMASNDHDKDKVLAFAKTIVNHNVEKQHHINSIIELVTLVGILIMFLPQGSKHRKAINKSSNP